VLNKDPANKYFTPKATDRDRAVFEAGIALGMVMHQFSGIPVRDRSDLEVVEEAIRRAILAQPFRSNAWVKLKTKLCEDGGFYSYSTVKTRDMDICVEVTYGKARVKSCVKYIEDLDYNLAYIEDIVEEF